MPKAGVFEATIQRHHLEETGKGTAFVALDVTYDDGHEQAQVNIYLSNKAANMAFGQLKRCGFDLHKQDLRDIIVKPTLLAGNTVQIRVYEEEYGGNMQWRHEIVTKKMLKPEDADDIQKSLRAILDPDTAAEEGDCPF